MKIKLKIGDRVTVRYIDGEMLAHGEMTVTEVCKRGFFAVPVGSEEETGEYIPYSKIGTSVFLDGKLMAERVVDENGTD